jgi:hypothetical protein
VTTLQQRLLKRLAHVNPGATMCPGQLSRDCGTTLRAARADIMALARAKKIALSQGNKPVKPDTLKGPFRVRLRVST